MLGFLIYCACSALFWVLGMHALVSKKPVGLWSHEMGRPKVKDVRGYNRAVAKLFFAYGVVLLLCGLPMLLSENPVLMMLVSVLGVAFGSIAMFAFAMKIDETYRGKH